VEIFLNYKMLEQVNKIKYLGIIFDGKLLFREYINYMEEKCLKQIFALSRSAKVTWGLGHEALKPYTQEESCPSCYMEPQCGKIC